MVVVTTRESQGRRQVGLSGSVSIQGLDAACEALRLHCTPGLPIDLSLAALEQMDTAVLVLLMEARRSCHAAGVGLSFCDVPDVAMGLAQAHGVSVWLGFSKG